MKPCHPKCNSFFRCAVALLLIPLFAPAQQPPANASDATIQALLVEVRQLRLALERSTTFGPRMQLVIARFQLQQDRVDRQERELRTLREQLANESLSNQRTLATLNQYVEQANQAQDPTIKKQSEDAAASARADIEQQAAREQQLKAEESDLSNRVKAEQAKLDDLAAQLDRLEKVMPQP